LSGALRLATVNGFSPAVGDTFEVMTFASRSGQFAAINGALIGNGNRYSAAYGATNLTLNVAAAAGLVVPSIYLTDVAGPGLEESSSGGALGGVGDLPRLSGFARTAAGASFQFPTAVGKIYRLEGTDDLASGRWDILVDRIEGTGTPVQVTDPGAASLPRYFYRIMVHP
jgi:hypothetical protein